MGSFGFDGNVNNYNTGLTYLGVWDALLNQPTLTSSVGIGGTYYIVSVAGTTNLNGITDWQVGDWAIYIDGSTNAWQKVDNHDVQAYSFIQNEGVGLPQQNTIDFQGIGVDVTNSGNKTIVTILSGLPATNYGLYSQISNSIPVTATIVESSLIGSGIGTLSVPHNGFIQGSSFRADFGGIMSSKNNDKIRIRVKSGSVVLADSGLQTLPSITNDVWQLSINFTIRQIGVAGLASIVSLGVFHDVKSANGLQNGFAFNTINSTTFDTTILNTLDVTAEWSSNSALNSIYSDIFVLNKIY
jgi:hypothetical protein